MWRWDQQEPFGNNVPDEHPSGLGTFDLPLRLPGQYFDKETNLSYNHFRDYDPALGRYAQSDPIAGARHRYQTSTKMTAPMGNAHATSLLQILESHQPYAYTVNSPLTLIDPLGLTVVRNNT